MNEIIKTIAKLVVLTIVATAILSISYSITKPLIEESRSKALKADLQNIFPNSDEIKSIGDHYEVYARGELIGYAGVALAKGYSSTLQVLVGIHPDKSVAGIYVLSQQETPGLGTRVASQAFLSEFVGKSASDLTLSKYGGKIDGIAGATITSRAVTKAVLEKVNDING